jgi:hypothetical protein
MHVLTKMYLRYMVIDCGEFEGQTDVYVLHKDR